MTIVLSNNGRNGIGGGLGGIVGGKRYARPSTVAYPTDQAARFQFEVADFLGDDEGGSDLTNNNTVTNPDDATRGRVAEFDGINQFLSGSYTGNSTGAASWTLWVNSDVIAGDVVLGNSASGNTLIDIDSTTVIGIRTISSGFMSFTVPTMSTGTWDFLAITRDGSDDFRVFLNAVESSTGALNGTGALALDFIGKRTGGSEFNGKLDDVQYFNDQLSAAEILKIYNTDLLP